MAHSGFRPAKKSSKYASIPAVFSAGALALRRFFDSSSAHALATSWLRALQAELRLAASLDLAITFGAELFTPPERYTVNGQTVQDLGPVRGYAALSLVLRP